MDFDIQYLLFLQNLRLLTGGIFDELFNAITKMSVDVLPFICFVVFWSTDRKWGYRWILTYSFAEVINGVIKLTVCAYRPWIRSDQIEPAGDSKVAATGYSFPSGHTVCATANYGSAFVWRKDKNKGFAIFCAVAILLTMFSRNFLGVHTPQDVIVGFLESCLLIWLCGKFINKYGDNEKAVDRATLIAALFTIVCLCYITLKPYPMDYVDGVLLVDPLVMMNDCYKAVGQFLGFLLGSYVERHYVRYKIPEGHKLLPILSFMGFFIIYMWKQYFAPATVILMFGSHWGNLIGRFIMGYFAMAIWPKVIMKATEKQ